jgi:putative transposase
MQACAIELMLQETLFNHFGENLPRKDKLEFSHNNGPEYIQKGLKKQLGKWYIKICNTPTDSTLYENCLDNPKIVKGKLQEWFDDYNSYAPHSAINMKTQQEFYKFKIAT